VKDGERREKARIGGVADSFQLDKRQVFGEGAPIPSGGGRRRR
jgi:hypothetical protein